MSEYFGAEQRRFQQQFGTEALAERVKMITVHDTVSDDERAFIESRDLFFLSSVDRHGQPTCSYKGGAPGFVRVLDAKTLAFPSYDGNGVFLSMGNIEANAKVGLLFIDFEQPNRLRLHGKATIVPNDPLLADYPEANLIVRVAVTELFVNCPRYIHRYDRRAVSKYVPKADCKTPLAQWKRIDAFAEALPLRDQAEVEQAGGLISYEAYVAKVQAGEG
ncbi:MAG: hypothetical protein NVS9B10_29740 [Nevskia sp.]